MEKPKPVIVDSDPEWVKKENARLKRQAECGHSKFICRCSICNAILFSDVTAEDPDHKWAEQIL